MSTRILLAEDDETLRTIMAEVLTDEGHAVTAVADGRAALEAFEAEPPPRRSVESTILDPPSSDQRTHLPETRGSRG